MNEAEDTQGLLLTLGVYVLIFVMKLTVYFMSGVMALLAEALHTLSDIFVSGFLLVATLYSRRQADETHMFGYGRAQNVAALVAATLFISFTSYKLYEEAIPRLFASGSASYQNLPLALGVVISSMVIAAAPMVKLLTQKTRGATAKAQLTELVNDELGLAAAMVGILFIMWGKPIADPIASIVVATVIAGNAVGLFRENLSFLIGRSPGPEYLEKVKELSLAVPGVLGVRDLRAEIVGPNMIHAGLRVVVQSGIPIEEVDRIVNEVHQRVHEGANAGYCVIQAESAKQETASAAT